MLQNPLLPSHPPTTSNSPRNYGQSRAHQYPLAVFGRERESGQAWQPASAASRRPSRLDGLHLPPLDASAEPSSSTSMSSINGGFSSMNQLYGGVGFDPAGERASSTSTVDGYHVPNQASQPASQVHSRANSPIYSQNGFEPSNAATTQALPPSMISPYLQLPASITKSKGSLAEFAAQITCLFWFESSATLSEIEQWNPQYSSIPITKLVPDQYPDTPFLKWVITILSTTQITQNVILLGLLFIYRLKKQNPTVRGNRGSEFRLLTVALMLGNKFLDDNTYTNKTWAEVSGIAVQEIHVMEVEFLSHMKYNLYTSTEDWQRWHQKLSRFYTFFDRATRKVHEPRPTPLNLRPSLHIPYALPSPPASTATSPPFRSSPTPVSSGYPTMAQVPQLPISPSVQLPDLESTMIARKRSYDHSMDEPSAKRLHPYSPHRPHNLSRSTVATPQHQGAPTLPPIPTLPVPVGQPVHGHVPTPPLVNPLQTGRNTPTSILPPVNWLQAVGPGSSSAQLPLPNVASAEGSAPTVDRSRWQASYTSSRSSPTSAMLPSTLAHPQNQYSPSHYLARRNSPYRPVRNMNTLLVPPPSGSLRNNPVKISEEQISWQPLAKQHMEPRTGPVPYFGYENWPSSNSMDGWNANYQQMYQHPTN